MENRVEYIFNSTRKNTIIDKIVALRDAIATEQEPVLNESEITLLKEKLINEKDRNVLRRIWTLACFSEFNEELFEYAKNKLNDEKYLRRDFALAFIGNQKPEFLPWLIEKYRHDKDPYVVFELAHLMLDLSPDDAVSAMIEIWLKIDKFDHETADSISMVVSKYGNKKHIDLIKEIKSRDQEHENYWNQWIDSLQKR